MTNEENELKRCDLIQKRLGLALSTQATGFWVLQHWCSSSFPLKNEGVYLGSDSSEVKGVKAQAALGQVCSSLGLLFRALSQRQSWQPENEKRPKTAERPWSQPHLPPEQGLARRLCTNCERKKTDLKKRSLKICFRVTKCFSVSNTSN